ncbi:MAG: hypothetical protein QOJ50_1562 [Cryptosporangiaceae bacterium]|nr:hypothetical protein [Cryptosporangiaceae bacterium]
MQVLAKLAETAREKAEKLEAEAERTGNALLARLAREERHRERKARANLAQAREG